MAGTKSRWNEWFDIRVLAGGGLLVLVGLLLYGTTYNVWPRIIEGSFYVICFALFAAHKPIRQILESLPSLQRNFLFCLVGMMLVAQIWSQPTKSYPLTPWDMYSQRYPQPFYYEYVGICQDGREIEFPAGRVFRSQHRTAPLRLHALWRMMNHTTDEEHHEQLSQQYHSLLTALVKRFNEKHPETQVERVRVVGCTMPRPAPGRKLEVRRRAHQEFTIR